MDKYSLLEKLGQGSFAVVWKARRKADGVLVAVKQFKESPQSWEECKKLPEVRAASAISDRRHIVTLLEAVRHAGELFLVFEYLESSLQHCAESQVRALEESQVRWVGARLLGALAAVHKAGLVHCDVKPENILVGADRHGEVCLRLCDFGQAAPPQQIGDYISTRWYRAPELLLGVKTDVAIDNWAAGCTLAELVLGRPLFPGTDKRDMLFRMVGELGAPEASWCLAGRVIEIARRCHAAGSAWQALAAAGASPAAVSLLQGLLQYDAARRVQAAAALRMPFFAPGLKEAPVGVRRKRAPSPESLRRQREEALEVERRFRDGSSSGGNGGAGAGDGFFAGRERRPSGSAGQGFGGDALVQDLPRPMQASLPTAAPVAVRNGMARQPPRCAGGYAGAAPPQSRIACNGYAPPKARPAATADAWKPSMFSATVAASARTAAPKSAVDDDDDEALADAFWDACKNGTAKAASPRPPPAANGKPVVAEPAAAKGSPSGAVAASCRKPDAATCREALRPPLSEAPARPAAISLETAADDEEEGHSPLSNASCEMDDDALADCFWQQVTGPGKRGAEAAETTADVVERATQRALGKTRLEERRRRSSFDDAPEAAAAAAAAVGAGGGDLKKPRDAALGGDALLDILGQDAGCSSGDDV
eukprot:TRINITY_DN70776_c0_g1_i1.p1 TRINITY_DN70776_c0_g1~~TRINITY_DN70776_c0_g1_i1.p1  ORF type:complete len:653 (+),score=175.75 TRINITY_DN70776_c0_g1_i1:106-2064(+)